MKAEERIIFIRQALTAALTPTHLEIIDESAKHHGHPGAKTGLGHFAIKIASPTFNNKNQITCHRMIYAALGNLMQTDIHALRINISPNDPE